MNFNTKNSEKEGGKKKQDLGLYVMNTHMKGPREQNAKLINKWSIGPQKLNQCLER